MLGGRQRERRGQIGRVLAEAVQCRRVRPDLSSISPRLDADECCSVAYIDEKVTPGDH